MMDADFALARKMQPVLRQLGGTSKEVARSLRRLGVQGRRRRTDHCPVAVYLRRMFPGAWVGLDNFGIGPDTAALPRPVSEFVRRFDKGAYRYLRKSE